MTDCPHCRALRDQVGDLESAARITILPGVLEGMQDELDGEGAAPGGAWEMLLVFYRNVKQAANAVREGVKDGQ
jgi:hypothetical protein